MRTLYPVLLIIAIGTASIMFSLSGFGAVFSGDDPTEGLQSGQQVNDSADKLAPEDGDSSFTTSSRGDDSFVGSIISAGSQIMSFATAAALLPLELQRIGFPQWMALPLGLSAQGIAFIGFLQFITGRIYE